MGPARHRIAFYLLCALLAVGSGAVAAVEVDLEIRSRLADPAVRTALYSPALVERFYAGRGHRPAWILGRGNADDAEQLLAALSDAPGHGLDTASYRLDLLTEEMARARHGFPAAQQAWLDVLLSDAFLTYGTHLATGRVDPKLLELQWEVERRSHDLVAVLEAALSAGRVRAALDALAPAHDGYARLRQALAGYRRIAHAGGWPAVSPGPRLELGVSGPRVLELRARLQAADLLEVTTSEVADPSLFDAGVEAAVLRFQALHGLAPDGVVGPQTLLALNVPAAQRVRQIELNLERWRWLPDDLGRRHIMVNIPGFHLSVVEDGRSVLEARVVVGKAYQPTPVFSATMRYVVFSPYWNVPRSIAVEEMLPRLRRDPYSLFRDGIHVHDAQGVGIDPGTVNWHAVTPSTFNYRLRQDPGPGNALGRVKFLFPNRHAVYLHDTPAPQLFQRSQRTFSHGCVRLSRPLELAEYLLADQGPWDRESIVEASQRQKEKWVSLAEGIPVHLLYWTAWVDEEGVTHFRHDVYERDPRLARALSAQGGTPTG